MLGCISVICATLNVCGWSASPADGRRQKRRSCLRAVRISVELEVHNLGGSCAKVPRHISLRPRKDVAHCIDCTIKTRSLRVFRPLLWPLRALRCMYNKESHIPHRSSRSGNDCMQLLTLKENRPQHSETTVITTTQRNPFLPSSCSLYVGKSKFDSVLRMD